MRLAVLFFLISFVFTAVAQEDTDSVKNMPHKLELSLNITSTLSNALGNSNNSGLLLDPYLFGLKYQLKGNWYARSGFNVKARQSTENNGQRTINESDYKVRLGIEKRLISSSKFKIYTGVDVVGGYSKSDVATSDFFGPSFTQIKTEQVSFGGGPVIGIMYRINKRISLSTEASLYYQATSTYRYLSLGFPDPTPIEQTTLGYILAPTIPSSLYLIVKF